MEDIQELVKRIEASAKKMRIQAVEMTYQTGKTGAHIGGGLSLIEIMAVLYLGILKFDKDDLQSENRDRLIFSKGHGTLALYTAMEQAGLLSADDLRKDKENDSILSAHPSMNPVLGIEFSSGSLGQGLSLGVGVGLALRRKRNLTSKVYVVLGDGECNEGSVWEAAETAAQYNLSNLIAIVDRNRLQYDGDTEAILKLEPFADKWKAFGWETAVVDGHDVKALYQALSDSSEGPYVVIADTIKGKGVSFMENNAGWHNGRLNKEQYEKAMQEVNA